ncbi:MAG TPA: hypothetical protein DDZ91_06940 [Firmicutes bacterium]|jgi:hypothetical protein|nr:hypothetical protein [Bacillota bacterium]
MTAKNPEPHHSIIPLSYAKGSSEKRFSRTKSQESMLSIVQRIYLKLQWIRNYSRVLARFLPKKRGCIKATSFLVV